MAKLIKQATFGDTIVTKDSNDAYNFDGSIVARSTITLKNNDGSKEYGSIGGGSLFINDSTGDYSMFQVTDCGLYYSMLSGNISFVATNGAISVSYGGNPRFQVDGAGIRYNQAADANVTTFGVSDGSMRLNDSCGLRVFSADSCGLIYNQDVDQDCGCGTFVVNHNSLSVRGRTGSPFFNVAPTSNGGSIYFYTNDQQPLFEFNSCGMSLYSGIGCGQTQKFFHVDDYGMSLYGSGGLSTTHWLRGGGMTVSTDSGDTLFDITNGCGLSVYDTYGSGYGALFRATTDGFDVYSYSGGVSVLKVNTAGAGGVYVQAGIGSSGNSSGYRVFGADSCGVYVVTSDGQSGFLTTTTVDGHTVLTLD